MESGVKYVCTHFLAVWHFLTPIVTSNNFFFLLQWPQGFKLSLISTSRSSEIQLLEQGIKIWIFLIFQAVKMWDRDGFQSCRMNFAEQRSWLQVCLHPCCGNQVISISECRGKRSRRVWRGMECMESVERWWSVMELWWSQAV